jgi:hypothetical protein
MATFIAHGLVGAAALTGITVVADKTLPNYLRSDRNGRLFVAILGFIEGTLPDTVDWIAATIFGYPRWILYIWWHDKMPWWLDILVFPAYLHVEMDKWFHRIPGADWWYTNPCLRYVEIGMWVIPLILLYIFLWRIKDENSI